MGLGDFTKPTKRLLAERAGYECSMPYCRVRTVGPGAAATETASVGQASHIYSAGAAGPRGRGGLSFAELADPANGIWTCELHAKDIDNNKGRAFPAGLLRSWKKLHEARIRRMSSGAPAERWIENLALKRSPLFAPGSNLYLSQVTVLAGTNGAGKTTLCEWLSAISNRALLDRWTGRNSRQAINLEITYTSDKEHMLGLDIPVGGAARFTLDGAAQLAPPNVIDIVFMRRRYLDPHAADDLKGLASFFGVDSDTIKLLAEHVGASGNNRFRHLGFEPAPLDEGEPPESILHENGEPRMQLVLETYAPAERYPLANFSGGVHTEMLLAMAIELAKFKSHQLPTLLLVDAADWGFAKEAFDRIAAALDHCAQFCQILLVEPHNRLDQQQLREREWVQYEIDMAPMQRGQPRPMGTLRIC